MGPRYRGSNRQGQTLLEAVAVRNFQSLESVDVALGTFTVVVGPNDLGKSALLRAIRSAAEASPGVEFITRGQSVARVALSLDGVKLLWEKGAQTNRYTVLRPDGTRQVFEKVGRSVPDDLSEWLALGKVDFGDVSLNLNFADQDDPPFLVPFPGGINEAHVAKVLGDLTNLSILFKAVQEANRQRTTSERTAANAESEAASLQTQLEPYQGLDARRTELAPDTAPTVSVDLRPRFRRLQLFARMSSVGGWLPALP